MTKELPSIEYLHKVLRYDPEFGLFNWLERTPDLFYANASKSAQEKCDAWNIKNAEEYCFEKIDADGYNVDILQSSRHRAVHVAWAMTYDVWPQQEGLRMHLNNNDREDNRLENLAPAERFSRPNSDPVFRVNGRAFTYG